MSWWQWAILAAAWFSLMAYTTQLILSEARTDRAKMSGEVEQLRVEIRKLVLCLGSEPAEHHPISKSRSVAEILEEAGREPLSRRRW